MTKVERTDAMTPPRKTTYLYDKARRLEKVRHPGYVAGPAHERFLQYDTANLLSQVTDGNGTVTQQTYDDAHRLTERKVTTLGPNVSPLATREVFGYDAIGRLATAETRYGWPTNPGNALVKVTFDPDSLGRESKQELFQYLGGQSTGGPQDLLGLQLPTLALPCM